MTEDPFDALAADYDASFTDSLVGRCLRRAVWRHLDAAFAAGDRVLDLGCGTGEDALHLGRRGVAVLAADRSAEMTAIARSKIAEAGLEARVEVRPAAIEDFLSGPFEDPWERPLDGAYSNFGAINCVADLEAVAEGLAACLQPGARVLLCLTGPLVSWEWLWFLARGRPAEAFRRMRGRDVRWRGTTVRYPSIRAVRRALRSDFRPRAVTAVGVLLPPTYADRWMERRPRLVERLDRWECRIEDRFTFPWLADHYLLELERSPERADVVARPRP